MDDLNTTPNQFPHIDIPLDVREDPFTLALLESIGKISRITINPVTHESEFHLPESKADLVVWDGFKGIWCPVVGAFADDNDLYIIVEDDGGLFIYSSSSRLKEIQYYNDGVFTSPVFEVNPLQSSQVCIITNIMENVDVN